MRSKAFLFSLFIILFIILGCNFPGGGAPVAPPTSPPDSVGQPGGPVSQEQPSDTPPAPPDTPVPADTATPENTPGLTAGTILYQTDFDNASGWNPFPWWRSDVQNLAGSGFKTKIASYLTEIQQGAYRFEVPKKYTHITSIYAGMPGLADVSVVADTILTLDRPWTFISVVCRYEYKVGWYEFYIQSDGQWGIRKISYVDGTVYELKDLTSGVATAINYGAHGAQNKLEATCLGEELILRVNSVTLGSVKDATFSTGLVGVGVAASEAGNSMAEFDSLQVQVP